MSAPPIQPSMGVLLISGGHERAHYALMVATAAAAIGREVTLFATNAGCRALLADNPLLLDAREAMLAEAGVATLAELLEAAEALGLRRIVCESGLRAEGLQEAPLAPGVELAGIVTFLAAVGPGQIVTL
ncbi:DsrE family protein [Roseococcus suduntuyensis]|uniref:Peroxiredoxin family protein n=1 Tax=Roseococcus suduntuyensis TaxID=455361 RepID=A0A840A8G6_9PROT|nr:DsrE family protein [Roseococcus suduntuyensis]MBB3897491.1 peroxiredoxin family protein [Roseococcus suduntuyensis]